MRNLILLLIAIVMSSCGLIAPLGDEGRACTREFRVFQVTVQDAEGRLVEGLDVKVTRAGNGRRINPCKGDDNGTCDYAYTDEGSYLVMTDANSDDLSPKGTSVRASADGIFTADFVFARGECHVEKLAGPDTVTVAR